jgi:pimeloyl-ACP methyl ester carboxylesterase
MCHDRGMSQAWRRHRVALPWGRLSVQVAGDGPPVLLLHGLGGSGRYWAGLAPHLAGRRTLIAPDLAGFGRSDKPDVDYSRAFHLGALDGLLRALGIEGPVSVAGHSMGGVLAALFAAWRPEGVDALALAASPFPRPRRHAHGPPPRGRVQLAAYRTVQLLLPALAPLVRSQTFPRAVVADYLRHTVTSYGLTSQSLIWDVAALDELDGLRRLDAVAQLLLYSNADKTIAPDSLERWQALLPQAETRIVPGGHQLLLRDGFSVLAEWLSQPAAARVA